MKKYKYVTANKICINGTFLNAVSGIVRNGYDGFMYYLCEYSNGATLKLLYSENTVNFGFTDVLTARIVLDIFKKRATTYSDFERLKNKYFVRG